ncbi:MAG: Nitrogen regulation protein [Verrucomicrobiota bacterium]
MKKHRILVVDDHPFFRSGLVQWLNQQDAVTCCGEAGSVAEASSTVRELQPDAVLMDLRLGDGEGLELIRTLSPHYPQMRFLALSQFDEDLYAHRALQAGARGYLMKSEATETVLGAIETVMNGGIHLSPKTSVRLLENIFPDPLSKTLNLAKLSDREFQVFRMLGCGRSTIEIARHLGISPKTVETYREHLKVKLSLGDAAALVRAATLWTESGRL